jgi:hypothetical protein
MNLKFKRSEAGQYRAEGASHIFTIGRSDGEWWLAIAEVLRVSGPKVGNPQRRTVHTFDLKSDAVTVAREFETLGNDYCDADHGGQSRYTQAVTRWYASVSA